MYPTYIPVFMPNASSFDSKSESTVSVSEALATVYNYIMESFPWLPQVIYFMLAGLGLYLLIKALNSLFR